MKGRSLVAIALLAVLASACTRVDEAQLALNQQVQDRLEIEDLMWRYARSLDSLDADGYAAVYAEDGVFTAGAMKTEGREALHKMVADMKVGREERAAKGEVVAGTLHMTANRTVEFTDADHATVHSYWLTAFPGQGAENPVRVAAVGRGVDELVRVDGKWLIKVRNVAPQD